MAINIIILFKTWVIRKRCTLQYKCTKNPLFGHIRKYAWKHLCIFISSKVKAIGGGLKYILNDCYKQKLLKYSLVNMGWVMAI